VGGFFPARDGEKQRPGGGAPWPAQRRAQARYLGHQNLIRFFLHALGIEAKPFCAPSTTTTVHKRPAAVARFSQAPTTMAAAHSDALAPTTTSMMAVEVVPSPPSDSSASNARA
jgi:hypothetical protein